VSSLRERFFRLGRRERLLAAVLLTALVVFSGSRLLQQLGAVREDLERVRADLTYQEEVLQRGPAIEARINRLLEAQDASQSLTVAEFTEIADRLSREAGLRPDMDPVETTEGSLVSVHGLVLSFDDVALVPLIDFARSLRESGRPVSVEEMVLSVNERRPTRLDADLRLTGFEFHDPTGALARRP
jgi:hypothetical protein